jgi:hypothetical protein
MYTRDSAQPSTNLKSMVCWSGFEETELIQLLQRMDADPETYYLSAESLNRWRGSLSYDEFPMRVCVSVQIISEARRLRVPTDPKLSCRAAGSAARTSNLG